MVEVLARICKSLAVALAQMIVLQAQCLAIDFVKDRQVKVNRLEASLHVFNTRVGLRLRIFQIFHALFDIALLKYFSVFEGFLKVFNDSLEGLLVYFILSLVNTALLLGTIKCGLVLTVYLWLLLIISLVLLRPSILLL